MPQDLVGEWKASGWRVAEVDGHDVRALYSAVKKALDDEKTPTCIVAKTVMSKGVPFIENDHNYHGKALTPDELDRALKELGVENNIEELRAKREAAVGQAKCCAVPEGPARLDVNPGIPREYGPDDKIDGRGAWGKALADIAEANPELPMAVFDCDLLGSVKTGDFKKLRPDAFFQAGIQEHHTAACAGACSVDAVLTWWADFGVFATDETYNQHRLSDINCTQLKVVATHCGLDVGEDGKTHQCIDYVGVFANLFGYKVFVPADGNQADRCVRFMATEPGNAFMAVGRSKLPVVLDQTGKPAFGGEWKLEYGRATKLRAGGKAAAAVLVMGQPTGLAVRAADDLKAEDVEVDVWNVCTPLAIDREAVKAAAATGAIVTVEDHHVGTGLAAQVSRVMAEEGLATASFRALGVGGYACSGSVPSLYATAGIDAKGIAEAVKGVLAQRK
jgi:transketolase